MDIAFVSCSKKKQEGLREAHRLYTSELFKRAYWYATEHHAHVYILSAKHGVVDPLQRIKSYNIMLSTLSRIEQKRWALRVSSTINRMVPPGSHLTFYCGQKYVRDLLPLLQSATCSVPLAHMGIGEQLHWYATQGYHSKAAC